MKKTNTSNPLKFFNDAKEARNKSFNKSLPKKGEGGRTMGPMTQQEAAAETAATSYPGPFDMLGSDAANIDVRNNYINNDMLNTIKANLTNQQYQSGLSSAALMKEELLNKQNQKENAVKQSAMIESMRKQKKGGTHKMPNGKIMLNSAMKKKTSKKK